MKKQLLSIIFIFSFLQQSFSQNPLVKQWDKRFGGTSFDWLQAIEKTADGGCILGGYSWSDSSGDKTQDTKGGNDYWIVKIDSLGNKQWDKDFGGSSNDLLTSLKQTSDGGYILGGSSYSDSSGDKSQASWGPYDYWIIKIDSLGNKQWDKDFGGTFSDHLTALQQTADRGYILGGWSYSDISGNKTQHNWDPSHATPDYWIIKTDSLGIKQWDKDFGGTEDDVFSSLQQTADGGYILGGLSRSDSSGNKSQNTCSGWPDVDYWVIKIDSLGNKQWDKDFGGTGGDLLASLKQAGDNGYILGGWSNSDSSGAKTQDSWGLADYWIIKTDSMGNK